MNIEQGKIRITETQEKLKCRRNIVSLLCVGKVVSLKEMTDGPFLSGLGQMETNSHLSAWEVTITKLGGHHHQRQCQGCANATSVCNNCYLYIPERER